jgi:RNA polymerase sigma-70 factor (ECF subfamily)
MNEPTRVDATTSLATRRSLLRRVKNLDDQRSWAEFFQRYRRLIHGVALKAGLTATEADEVVQETMLELTRRMPTFEYDSSGSFKGWLLRLTQWRISDQLRKRARQLRLATPPSPTEHLRTSTVARVPDPASLDIDQVWHEEWKRGVLDLALQRVRRQVSPKHYQIFDLYVTRNWPVRQVREALRVSQTQVYLAKYRVGQLLKKEVQRLEKSPF